MEFINNLGFEQGKRTAIIELINCLSSHIIQLAEYYPKQEEQNIEGLEREIKDPIYSCFRYVANDSYFIDGALNTLCMKLDIRKAYALAAAKTSTPKAKFRFCLKKSASFLLKYIRL